MANAVQPEKAGPSAWAVGLVVLAVAFAATSLVLCVMGVGPA